MPVYQGSFDVTGEGAQDVSPGYSRSTGQAAKEVGRQFIGGVAADLPRMAGQGLRWLGGDDSYAGRTGADMADAATLRAQDYEPNDAGSGAVGRTLSMGARAVGPMIPTIAASMIPGVGEVAGPAMAGAFFGTSSAQDTYDKIFQQTGNADDARAAGYLSGAIQGPAEALSAHVGGMAFRALKPAGTTMADVVGSMTNPSALKSAAKGIGLNMLVEPATEVAQDVGTELVERAYGAKPEDLLGIAKNSAQGAIGLTALLAPFAVGAHVSHAKRAAAFDAALNNPQAPAVLRQQAEAMVVQQAEENGVPTEQINAWKQQRAQQTQAGVDPSAPIVSDTGANLLTGQTPAAANVEQQRPAEIAAAQAVEQGNQAVQQEQAQQQQVAQTVQAEQPTLTPEAQQQQAVATQQQEAETQAATEQQSRVDQVKKSIAERQAAVAAAENELGGTEVDEKGKRAVKVPSRYVETYNQAKTMADLGVLTPEQFQTEKENLIAALQTNDNKTLNDVRKRLDELANPPEKPAEKPAPAPKPATAPAPVAATPAAAPATVKPSNVGVVRRAPRPETKPVVALKPAPVAASPAVVAKPATKFDNVPDLADAVAKESGLPQAVADAYTQAVVLGRAHAVVAKELGVGKSTVGDWTREMTKLVEAAKPTRLERDAETVEAKPKEELVTPENKTEERTESVQEAQTENEAEEQPEAETHADLNAAGDLADEDNHNPYQSDNEGETDSNINITDAPHGEGKTSADNNIDKARLAALSKKWDQFNKTLPEDHRVKFTDLGSAQQDTFDTESSKGEARGRKAHAVITQLANEGIKYASDKLKFSSGIEAGTIAGVRRITVAMDMEAHPENVTALHAMFPALQGYIGSQRYEVRPANTTELQITAAAADNLLNSVAAPFSRMALRSVTAIQVFPKEAIPGAAGVYSPGIHAIAFNEAYLGAPDIANTDRERKRSVQRAEILVHELTHAMDTVAGELLGNRYHPATTQAKSPVRVVMKNLTNGKTEVSFGPVMAEAVKKFYAEPDVYHMLEQPLAPLMEHMMAAAESDFDTMSIDIVGLSDAADNAMTELVPRLMEMILTDTALLNNLPLGRALAQNLAKSTSIDEVATHLSGGSSESKRNVQGAQTVGVRAGADRFSKQVQDVSAADAHADVPAVQGADRQEPGGRESAPRPGNAGGGRGGQDRLTLPALDKPGGIGGFIKSIFGDKLYRNFPSLLGALSTEQLADRFSEHPLVQKFSDAMQRMGGMSNHLIGEANPVIRDWASAARKAGKDKANAFGQVLLDSTTKGMWPTKEWADAAHGYLRASIDPKTHTPLEIVANEKANAALAAEHAELKARFDALPAELKNLYDRIEQVNRANFERHVAADRQAIIRSYYPSLEDVGPSKALIDTASAAVTKRARKAFLDAAKLNAYGELRVKALWDSMDDHKSDYDNKLKGPYFPLSRFGEHIVSYKSKEYQDAEKAVETARDALTQAKDGAHAGERAEVEQEIAVLRRKLARATAPESTARHTADLEDALARQETLDSAVASARKTLQDRTDVLNGIKSDPSHYAVEFHENREVAKQRAAQLEAFFGGDGTAVQRTTRDQYFSQQDRATPAYMKRIEDHLVGSLTGAEAEEIRKTVREMYIQNLPGTHALKHQLKRRSVPGVRADETQRAFATKAVKDAYSISRKTFMGELHEHVSSMRFGDNKDEDGKILGNELAKRMALNSSMKTNAAISFATNATYFAQLGLSPGFMLQQATQQWVNTAPMMAARHGVGTATRQLAKGTSDAARILKVSFDQSKSKMSFAVDLDAAQKAGTIDAKEAAMLKDMFEHGTIDIASSHDAGIAMGGGELDTFSRAAQMANWPVQQLEVMNRISTALAGYRAEVAKAGKEGATTQAAEARATKYAEKLVSETHMNYASENRARFIHPNSWGGWGRIMFQFRAYQQGMAYLTAKNIIDGLRGDKEARKAAAYMTGMQLATAGLAGMPIPGAMIVIAHLLYGAFTDDDDEKDLKEMMYQGFKSIGGDAFANLVTRGVPAALGVDVSGKLGAGNIFDVAPFVRNQKDGRDLTAAYVMSIVGGAAGGQVANMAEAIHQASLGEFGKAAMLLPGKTVTDIIKAVGYQAQGTKDSRGNTILSPDEIDTASTIIKALGLQPTQMQRVSDERQAFFEARANRNDARAKLLADYARRKIAGEDTADVMEHIRDFNGRHKDDRIAMGALPVAVQKRREMERNRKNGVPVGKRDKQLYEDVLGN